MSFGKRDHRTEVREFEINAPPEDDFYLEKDQVEEALKEKKKARKKSTDNGMRVSNVGRLRHIAPESLKPVLKEGKYVSRPNSRQPKQY
mmetsp:Transcript_4837/g.6397  ORF Transcript_4837/g.6397 Transcript_4837/m.6397 type:complete len:89 (-) Transcript_4837:2200-2466(-)